VCCLCVNVYCTTATGWPPIAVKYIISYNISHHISYHISYHISHHITYHIIYIISYIIYHITYHIISLLYSLSGPSWALLGWTLPLTFYKWHSTVPTVRHIALYAGIACLNFKHFCIVIREYLCCRGTPPMPTLIILTGCYCNRNSVISVIQEPSLMNFFQITKERPVCSWSLSVRPPFQATFIKLAFGTFMKFNLQLITDLHVNLLMILRYYVNRTSLHANTTGDTNRLAACNKCRNKVREIEGYVVSTPRRVLLNAILVK
jgi:hypothetical protein